MFPCHNVLWWSSLCTNKRINSSDTPAEGKEEEKVLLEKEEEEDQNRVKEVEGERKKKELEEKQSHLSWDTHPGLAPPRADLLDNAAFQLSNLPGSISSAISEIILPFSYFKAHRNTSLPAMIKCECSNLGRGEGTGQSGKKLILTHSILLSPPLPQNPILFRNAFWNVIFLCLVFYT